MPSGLIHLVMNSGVDAERDFDDAFRRRITRAGVSGRRGISMVGNWVEEEEDRLSEAEMLLADSDSDSDGMSHIE